MSGRLLNMNPHYRILAAETSRPDSKSIQSIFYPRLQFGTPWITVMRTYRTQKRFFGELGSNFCRTGNAYAD
jgi:hypothetical protein